MSNDGYDVDRYGYVSPADTISWNIGQISSKSVSVASLICILYYRFTVSLGWSCLKPNIMEYRYIDTSHIKLLIPYFGVEEKNA